MESSSAQTAALRSLRERTWCSVKKTLPVKPSSWKRMDCLVWASGSVLKSALRKTARWNR